EPTKESKETPTTEQKEVTKSVEVSPQKEDTMTQEKANEVPTKEETPPEVVKEEPSKRVVKEGPAKYHISQNKDTDAEHASEWRVRKESSTKTIKYYRTQKEAIEFAEKLAKNQDSSIVIHKKDGSIRKQDYTKK